MRGSRSVNQFGSCTRLFFWASAAMAVIPLIGSSALAVTEDWQPLWSATTLSQPRYFFAGAAAGNKIVFAGGDAASDYTTRADIFDVSTKTWSTANLSQARRGLVAAASGDKILFAGGESGSGVSNRVDIYDTSSNSWTTASLSAPRSFMAAAAAGGKVVFAGGYDFSSYRNNVDIYDVATNSWSTSTLSLARYSAAGASVGSKVLFAGGRYASGASTGLIDVYDTTTATWSTSSLTAPTESLASASVGNFAYFAGAPFDSTKVDVYNATTNTTSSTTPMSVGRQSLAGAAVGNKVIFAGGLISPFPDSAAVDIYDTSTSTHTTSALSAPREGLAAAASGRYALFAGGLSNGPRSSVVDIYRLQEYDAVDSASVFTLADDTTVLGDAQLNTGAELYVGGKTLKAAALRVGGGASLHGAGSINAAVTLAGGNSPATRGDFNLVDGIATIMTLSDANSLDTALRIGGSAANAASSLEFDIGASADRIAITNAKLLVDSGGGLIQIVPRAGITNGTYTLITFPGGQASGLANLSVSVSDPTINATLQTTSTSMQVVISNAPEPAAGVMLMACVASMAGLRHRRRAFDA